MADPGWHLDRRISLGHLVTTVTFLVAMVLWGARLETRITVTETTVQAQKEQVNTGLHDVKVRLQNIEAKLDRAIERQSNESPRQRPF